MHPRRPLLWLSFAALALFSLLAFLLIVGPRVLDFQNIAWLASGDPATHYLGWAFFRHSPWSFPIGLNPDYGMDISSSIVYSDSIPLLAFLFKPFQSFLPEPFQYLGLWALICFVLQAYFAWLLVGLITQDFWQKLLGMGFFVFAPPMLYRLGVHAALASHFLLLAGLYLVMSAKDKGPRFGWTGLLSIAVLVNFYLLK